MFNFKISDRADYLTNVPRSERYSIQFQSSPFIHDDVHYQQELFFASKKKANAFLSELSEFCVQCFNFLDLINTRISVIQLDRSTDSEFLYRAKSRVYHSFSKLSFYFSNIYFLLPSDILDFISRISSQISLFLKELRPHSQSLSNTLFSLLLDFDENFENKVLQAYTTHSIKFF